MKFAIPLLASAFLVIGAMNSTRAQTPAAPDITGPVYVVSYIDVQPRLKSQGITALKQFRSACVGEAGNLRCEAIQRMEQQNEFAVLEVWKDRNAYQAHVSGPGAQFRDRLKPLLASPYDERVQSDLAVLPPRPAPGGRIVYAIAHVDIFPDQEAQGVPLLTRMAEVGRSEQGNGRLEVLRQLAPLTDHFTVVEIWSNKRLLENHQAQPSTMQFREALQPLLGSPYDERIYKILD
jgi:quinol monooxygenase YgiN